MHVTDELADWEDSRNMDRKRQWFSIDDALEQLALHKPVQRRYLQQLKNSKTLTNSTNTTAATIQQHTAATTTNNTAASANLLSSPSPQPPASTMHQMQSTTN